MGLICAWGGQCLNAGYLTILESVQDKEDTYLLRIPNQEALKEFKSLTAYHLNVEVAELEGLYYGLIEKDQERFIQSYEHILLANPSFYDLKNENSYQAPWPAVRMLLLGICLYIKNDYDVLSNRETGKGRSDIILKAKRNDLPSYVIEMHFCAHEAKYTSDIKKLKSLLNKGESQINESKYDFNLKNEVIHIVIAHCSKDIAVKWIEI